MAIPYRLKKNPLLLLPRYENQALSRGIMSDDSSAAYLGQAHMDRPVSSKLPAGFHHQFN